MTLQDLKLLRLLLISFFGVIFSLELALAQNTIPQNNFTVTVSDEYDNPLAARIPIVETRGDTIIVTIAPDLVVRADKGLNNEFTRQPAATVTIEKGGFYRTGGSVLYSQDTRRQSNESYFLEFCDGEGLSCIEPLNPNAGTKKVVPDSGNGELPILRNSGIFLLPPGEHTIFVNHFIDIANDFRQFWNCGAPGDTLDTSCFTDTGIIVKSPESVHMSGLRIFLADVNFDLAIQKNANKEKIFSSEIVSYELFVENVGTSTVHQITIKDVIPGSVEPLNFNIEPVNFNSTTLQDSLCWEIDSLRVGESRVFSYDAQLDTSLLTLPDTLVNIATLSALGDTNLINNIDSAVVIVGGAFDLKLEKTASADTVLAGTPFSYFLDIINLGPHSSVPFTLEDVLPDSVILGDFVLQPPDSVTDVGLFWQFNSLAPGDSLRIEFKATFPDTIDLVNPLNIVNSSFLIAEFDTTTANDTSVVTVVVLPKPLNYDLELTKSASADTVFPGEAFTYSITVTNRGPNTSDNIFIKDVLPDSIQVSGFSITPLDSSTSDFLIWEIAALDSADSVVISFTAQFPDSLQLTNKPLERINSSFLEAVNDTNAANDTSQVSIFVAPPSHDLELTKSVGQDTVFQNDVFTYSLNIVNHGPSNAFNFTVKDALPDSIRVVEFVTQPPDVFTADTLFWNFEELAVGDSIEILFTAQFSEGLQLPADTLFERVNQALLNSANDVNPANDTSQVSIFVAPASHDLELTKSVSQDTVLQNDVFTYSLNIVNHGPSNAFNFTVKDALPDSIQVAEFLAQPPDVFTADTLFWSFEELAVGDSIEILFTAQLSEGLQLPADTLFEQVNQASLNSSNDINPDNNEAAVSVFIKTPPGPRSFDLQTKKSATVDSVRQNEDLTFVVQVTNLGPDASTSFLVEDDIPDLLTVISTIPEPINSLSSDTLRWQFEPLAFGESIDIVINAEVPCNIDLSSYPFEFSNLAWIIANDDSNSVNNLDRASIFVTGPCDVSYDLELTKSVSQDTIFQSESFRYTLKVVNHGEGDAGNIVLRDLPSDFLSLSNFNIQPETIEDSLSWSFNNLAAGDSIVIEYDAELAELPTSLPFPIVNNAQVFSPMDINDSNNSASAVVIVGVPENQCIVLSKNVFQPERGEPLRITFELRSNSNVKMNLYDITGTLVTSLVDRNFNAGQHTFTWDGRTENGMKAGSGVYIMIFSSDNLQCCENMILVR